MASIKIIRLKRSTKEIEINKKIYEWNYKEREISTSIVNNVVKYVKEV